MPANSPSTAIASPTSDPGAGVGAQRNRCARPGGRARLHRHDGSFGGIAADRWPRGERPPPGRHARRVHARIRWGRCHREMARRHDGAPGRPQVRRDLAHARAIPRSAAAARYCAQRRQLRRRGRGADLRSGRRATCSRLAAPARSRCAPLFTRRWSKARWA